MQRMDKKGSLRDDSAVIRRVFEHIDNNTTDLGELVWREPVEHYLSPARLEVERRVLRSYPVTFCPSAALPETGSYVARSAAGTPIVAVRGQDGEVRAFRNACRHRGTQLVAGVGCKRALVCPYHGWTYELDGSLRHVPHQHGFPELDKNARGLVPLATVEHSGLIFVTQDSPHANESILDGLPALIPQNFALVDSGALEVVANWKIAVESFLEGYHIRATHMRTFFPVQYDNLNVVERFGKHSRITFPYQAIEKLRPIAPEARRAEGKLTYVYHLFPNVMVATFPTKMILVVLEPLALDRTRFITYSMTDRGAPGTDDAKARHGDELVDAGAAEDREMIGAVQRGLASGANEFLEFGLFESAIGHFHRELQAAIDATIDR